MSVWHVQKEGGKEGANHAEEVGSMKESDREYSSFSLPILSLSLSLFLFLHAFYVLTFLSEVIAAVVVFFFLAIILYFVGRVVAQYSRVRAPMESSLFTWELQMDGYPVYLKTALPSPSCIHSVGIFRTCSCAH